MEQENPSANPHPQSIIKTIANRLYSFIYFFRRVLRGDVGEYTRRDRLRDVLVDTRRILQIECVYRTRARMYNPAYSLNI
jgi:hypothetical protein